MVFNLNCDVREKEVQLSVFNQPSCGSCILLLQFIAIIAIGLYIGMRFHFIVWLLQWSGMSGDHGCFGFVDWISGRLLFSWASHISSLALVKGSFSKFQQILRKPRIFFVTFETECSRTDLVKFVEESL